MKIATGHKENKRPQAERSGGLRLLSRTDSPKTTKKAFQIGICENLFSPPSETPKDDSCDETFPLAEVAAFEGRAEPAVAGTKNLIACAVLGLAVGYLFGKLGRKTGDARF